MKEIYTKNGRKRKASKSFFSVDIHNWGQDIFAAKILLTEFFPISPNRAQFC